MKDSNYINSKVKNHNERIYLNIINKSISTGEFILIEGKDDAAFLVLDIKHNVEDDQNKFEVNQWKIPVDKAITNEIIDKFNELVREVQQKNLCMLINVQKCIGNAYILNDHKLKDTKYASYIGMEHIYRAKHHIARSGDHFIISHIMESHINFPLEHDTGSRCFLC